MLANSAAYLSPIVPALVFVLWNPYLSCWPPWSGYTINCPRISTQCSVSIFEVCNFIILGTAASSLIWTIVFDFRFGVKLLFIVGLARAVDFIPISRNFSCWARLPIVISIFRSVFFGLFNLFPQSCYSMPLFISLSPPILYWCFCLSSPNHHSYFSSF